METLDNNPILIPISIGLSMALYFVVRFVWRKRKYILTQELTTHGIVAGGMIVSLLGLRLGFITAELALVYLLGTGVGGLIMVTGNYRFRQSQIVIPWMGQLGACFMVEAALACVVFDRMATFAISY